MSQLIDTIVPSLVAAQSASEVPAAAPRIDRPFRTVVGSFLATIAIGGTAAMIASAVLSDIIDRRTEAQLAAFAQPDPSMADAVAQAEASDAAEAAAAANAKAAGSQTVSAE